MVGSSTVTLRAFGCLLASMAGLVVGSGLEAQVVELRPQAGLYLPTRISLQNGVLHVRQKIGVTVGARLSLIFSDRFDVVTGVSYIPGYATFRGAGKRVAISASSHQLTGSTGARYWLKPRGQKLAWEVHTGLGLAFGGKPSYEDLFESSTMNGVLGTSLHYQILRIVSLQLRVQERLFRLRFGNHEAGKSSRPLQVSFGVGLPIVESAP